MGAGGRPCSQPKGSCANADDGDEGDNARTNVPSPLARARLSNRAASIVLGSPPPACTRKPQQASDLENLVPDDHASLQLQGSFEMSRLTPGTDPICYVRNCASLPIFGPPTSPYKKATHHPPIHPTILARRRRPMQHGIIHLSLTPTRVPLDAIRDRPPRYLAFEPRSVQEAVVFGACVLAGEPEVLDVGAKVLVLFEGAGGGGGSACLFHAMR